MGQMEVENRKKSYELKHLGFARLAAINALFCISNLYDYAKRNSGPLRSTVGTVEGAVAPVLGPVYEKFKGVPDDLLLFLDEKVDEASHKFDEHAPPLAKKIVSRAHDLIEIALEKAQRLVHKAQAAGLRAAFYDASTETKQLLLSQSVTVWFKLNKAPPLRMVAEMAIPTAAHWSKKYNRTVKKMSRKGYPVFGCLPLIPVGGISKAFKQGQQAKKEGHGESGSSSKTD